MPEAIVVGGGVIGTSCALALADLGLSVTLIDDREAGATHYAAGILMPSGKTRTSGKLGKLNAQAVSMWPEWEQLLGRGLVGRRGKLQLAEPGDSEKVREWPGRFKQLGIEAQWVSETEARDIAPHVNPQAEVCGGCWVKKAGSLDPLKLLSALRLKAAENLVVFQQGKVVELLAGQDKARGVRLKSGLELKANWVVAAGGLADYHWLPQGSRPRLIPQLGERAVLKLAKPLPGPIIGTPGGSLVPRDSGEIWAGVTALEGVSRSYPSLEGAAHVLSNALHYLPELREAELYEIGAGVRPLSQDELPLVGPTQTEGLLLACGHGRDGILQSPAAAKALAGLIQEGRLPEWSLCTNPVGRTA